MGELAPARHITDGMDPLVARPQGFVRPDALRVERDVRLLQIEPARGRYPADRDQQVRAGNPRLSFGTGDNQHRAVGSGLDTDGLCPGAQFDAVRAQLRQCHLGGLRILTTEDVGSLYDDDLGAETAKRLAQFDPDRAASQHDQPARPLCQFEDGFIGQIGRGLEPGDRRDGRARPRGDDDLARLHPNVATDHDAAIDETGRRADDANAQTFEPRLTVDGRDGGDRLMDVGHDGGEIDGRI